MSNLSAFLNPVKPENIKIVVSKRFVDPETGQAAEWEIKAIGADEEEALRKSCTKNVTVPGNKNQYVERTDQSAYVRKLAVACIVSPDLNSVELQDAYGVMGADKVLLKMLLPGEFAELLGRIQEITGFDAAFQDEVDEAKN